MKNRNTILIFTLLIVLVALQELYQFNYEREFTIGIMPMLLFGTIWNMFNGLKIYKRLPDKTKFNLGKFIILTIVGLIYLIAYAVCWNFFGHRPTQQNEGSGMAYFIFLPLSGLISIFIIYIPYYTINFVSRGLLAIQKSERRKWEIVLAIILFPVGIWLIQPIVDQLETN